MTSDAVPFDVAIEIRGGDSPVMKPVTPFVDQLPINGRRVVVRRDEFDHHVASKTHGDSNIGGRVFAAIFCFFAGEMFEQEPWPDFELLDPVVYCLANVLDDVCRLDNSVVWLTEIHKAHGSVPPRKSISAPKGIP